MREDDRALLGACIGPVIAWQRAGRKDLPWRREVTPYRVWISEIMLQQTRIEAVIPYYERFLRALPTVEALASVPEDTLLKLWEGLGYYSRARNLKKAAQMLVRDNGGQLPREPERLLKLPGIGAYTAGAIASIAYGMPAPAVDGNVLRVLSRVLASDADISSGRTRAEMAATLGEHYPAGRDAGLLTEGLMELGQRLCVPNGRPECGRCPLAALCRAHLAGAEDSYPVKSPKKERRIEPRTVLLLCHEGRWAIRRRPETGLLAKLWELPGQSGTLTAAQARALAESWGCAPVSCRPAGKAKHVFTHVQWHMTGYLMDCAAAPDTLTWVTPAQLERDVALPAAFRAYRERIREL